MKVIEKLRFEQCVLPGVNKYDASPVHTSGLWSIENDFKYRYRTRAIRGRSRLVAAPLRNHAKRQFLWLFYVIIGGPKRIIFEYKARPLMAQLLQMIFFCLRMIYLIFTFSFCLFNIGFDFLLGAIHSSAVLKIGQVMIDSKLF